MVQKYLDEALSIEELSGYLDDRLTKIEKAYQRLVDDDSNSQRRHLLLEASELLNAIYDALETGDLQTVEQLAEPTQEALSELSAGRPRRPQRQHLLPPNFQRLLERLQQYRLTVLGRDHFLMELGYVEGNTMNLRSMAESYRGLDDVNPGLLELFYAGIDRLEKGLADIRTGVTKDTEELLDTGEVSVREGAKLLVRAQQWIAQVREDD